MYKTHGQGNVRNRKAYDAGLDMIKFDMIKVQNPRVSPTDLDSFMERKGHMCIGEVKHVGTGLNKGQQILKENMRKYHGAWYFFAQATREGIVNLQLDSDFVSASFNVIDGWYDYELYIVLSCYHQLMFLFANTFNYGRHPRLFNDEEVRARTTAHFVSYATFVCEEFARGKYLVLPKSANELHATSGYGQIKAMLGIMSS